MNDTRSNLFVFNENVTKITLKIRWEKHWTCRLDLHLIFTVCIILQINFVKQHHRIRLVNLKCAGQSNLGPRPHALETTTQFFTSLALARTCAGQCAKSFAAQHSAREGMENLGDKVFQGAGATSWWRGWHLLEHPKRSWKQSMRKFHYSPGSELNFQNSSISYSIDQKYILRFCTWGRGRTANEYDCSLQDHL